eukprot:6884729-Prymnesium_polylepis.2
MKPNSSSHQQLIAWRKSTWRSSVFVTTTYSSTAAVSRGPMPIISAYVLLILPGLRQLPSTHAGSSPEGFKSQTRNVVLHAIQRGH